MQNIENRPLTFYTQTARHQRTDFLVLSPVKHGYFDIKLAYVNDP